MAEVKDPVCGMTIEEATAAATVVYDGTTYYFCSKRCADRFEKDPQGFV
ncbi:MAG: YHS domain-containing protein [Acidimicrobiia bacterium]